MSTTLLEKVLEEVETKLAKESKVYGCITIILSLLDILAGTLCILYATLQVTAFITSILSGAVVFSRAIQILKAKNLLNTIKVLSGLSGTYLMCRMKKSKRRFNMNSFVQAIKNNPLTIIFAVLGAGVMFYVGYVLSGIWFDFATIGNVLVGVFFAILAVLVVVLLGWDKAKAAILRGAKKTLSEEAYNNLVNVATMLENEEAKAKAEKDAEEARIKKEADEKAAELSYIQAKELIAKYEANQETNKVE